MTKEEIGSEVSSLLYSIEDATVDAGEHAEAVKRILALIPDPALARERDEALVSAQFLGEPASHWHKLFIEECAEGDALASDNERLRAALEEIADQKLLDEISPDEREHADCEGAYEDIVRIARAALTPTKKEPK